MSTITASKPPRGSSAGSGSRSHVIASAMTTRTCGSSSAPELAARIVVRARRTTSGSSSTWTIVWIPGLRSSSRAASPSPPPSTSTDRASAPSAGYTRLSV
jgi:hypothetical protein